MAARTANGGETYSLNLAREMWEGSGYRVIGASLAARAAKELEDQAHIQSRTIAKLMIDLDRGIETLDDRTVLVIDEASMVGTRAPPTRRTVASTSATRPTMRSSS